MSGHPVKGLGVNAPFNQQNRDEDSGFGVDAEVNLLLKIFPTY